MAAGPRLLAAAVRGPALQSLPEPVTLSVAELTRAWDAATFDARCCGSDAGPEVLLPGMLVRLPAASAGNAGYAAFCLLCPHEMCHVELRADSQRAPPGTPRAADRPFFVCPCHLSVFDPSRDGARISGPAPRGLYQFELIVSRQQATVTAVEAAVLEW